MSGCPKRILEKICLPEDPPSPLVAVIGPTGSGKSHLALQLARQFGGEIVNCDSIQVHRGLNIGAAKLPPAWRLSVPHHLIDIIDPCQELTAGGYARRARQAIHEITGRGNLPVVAGGTGFYLRALLEGLSPAPLRDETLRHRLQAISVRCPSALFRYLRRFDPAAARRIHPNDQQKLIRAIEMTIRAGQPASAVQSAARAPLQGYRVLKLGLAPPRAELYAALNRRSAAMFEQGLVEETSQLLRAGVPLQAKALCSLGYKQAVQVLTAGLSLENAVQELQTRTRQYAKRQMTWFRRETDVNWLAGFGHSPSVEACAAEFVRSFLAV